jgi:hypothetical protein
MRSGAPLLGKGQPSIDDPPPSNRVEIARRAGAKHLGKPLSPYARDAGIIFEMSSALLPIAYSVGVAVCLPARMRMDPLLAEMLNCYSELKSDGPVSAQRGLFGRLRCMPLLDDIIVRRVAFR